MTAELLSLVPFEVPEPASLAEHRQALARRAAWRLEDAPAEVIIRWAARTFGPRLALTSSMADAVLMDLFARHAPGTDVLFLDTSYHFPETLGMRDAVQATYRGRLNIVTLQPAQTVAQQDAAEGRDLFATDPDRCCALRKVAPLDGALAGYDAWASGLRRDESFARSATPVVDWDRRNGRVKVNPIARWDQSRVDAYVEAHGVLVNTLLMDGYASIGCLPCTSRVGDVADMRAGRWAGRGKSECGIHLVSG
jgi:phosphoadenosine phosphosulfate reductase